jgi:hypothetical protein
MSLSNPFIVPYDDFSRFATPEIEEAAETSRKEDPFLTSRDRIIPMLEMIPPREADIVEMLFFQHKRQEDVAQIFGMSQGAISYRLQRAQERIKFLLSLPVLSEDDLERDLKALVPGEMSDIQADVLVSMYTTTSQKTTGLELGISQGRVRHNVIKGIAKLKKIADVDPKYQPYYQWFSAIHTQKMWNIKRESNSQQHRRNPIGHVVMVASEERPKKPKPKPKPKVREGVTVGYLQQSRVVWDRFDWRHR